MKERAKKHTQRATPASTPSDDEVGGITRIMATSQRTAPGTTIFKGKGPHCYGKETLEWAWIKRNIKK